jgi:hypothetical protein
MRNAYDSIQDGYGSSQNTYGLIQDTTALLPTEQSRMTQALGAVGSSGDKQEAYG